MTNKTLEEKIQTVCFWAFGGLFWYLVVAFFLKSSYPIYQYNFNPSMAYEVIKDALTLLAAFLAPVAAFVLFSDWRSQHILISNEKISSAIKDNILKIEKMLLQGGYNTHAKNSKLWEDYQEEYIDLLAEIRRLSSKLNLINQEVKELNIFLKDFNYIASDCFKLHAKAVRSYIKFIESNDDKYFSEASTYGSKSMLKRLEVHTINRKIKILYV